MTESKFVQAATVLLDRRVAGTKAGRLDESIRPNSSEEALQIHQQMIKLRTDHVGGWKCLRPLAEDQYIVAPIFADTLQQGEQCFLFADRGAALIEPEISFVLGADLPAQQTDYSDAQIDQAIASCHMALELMQGRFADDCDPSFYEKLADGLVNQGLFIGPEINKSYAYAASNINITVKQGEETQQFAGKHPNILPQNPIYWLINFMSKRGTSFKAGQAIITGSYAGIVEVAFDQPTEIEYENLGKYTVEF
ncbi:MAG TPA: hydratase, partial [Psychromonas sp.]